MANIKQIRVPGLADPFDLHDVRLPSANANNQFLKADYSWDAISCGANTVEVTLLSIGWSNGSQTVSVTGLTADGTCLVGMSSSSTSAQREAAGKAQLYISTQATGSLTFAYDGTEPTVDLPVSVLIFEGTATSQLATVATSGSYEDLSDKPSIPSFTSSDATLLSSGWSNNTQTVTVSGMTSSAIVWIGLSNSATSAQRDAAADAELAGTTQSTDSLIITAYGDVPTVDIPINVTFVG